MQQQLTRRPCLSNLWEREPAKSIAAESQMTAEQIDMLSLARSGEWVEIRRMQGGHQFLSRLASLGFTPGARLKVIQNYHRGPILVSLRDTRVALGRGEAEKIVVRRLLGEDNGR
jgi:ferrous iron transport protein A